MKCVILGFKTETFNKILILSYFIIYTCYMYINYVDSVD